jgi:hypothetical protein
MCLEFLWHIAPPRLLCVGHAASLENCIIHLQMATCSVTSLMRLIKVVQHVSYNLYRPAQFKLQLPLSITFNYKYEKIIKPASIIRKPSRYPCYYIKLLMATRHGSLVCTTRLISYFGWTKRETTYLLINSSLNSIS